MLHEAGEISRSHGISRGVLERQAKALDKEIVFGAATWQGYEETFISLLKDLKARGHHQVVFGDIDIDQHREWEERVSCEADMTALLPLWGEGRRELVDEFLAAGFRAVIVDVRDRAMRHWLGQEYGEAFVAEAVHVGWDACGEAGEFHTFVYDGPIFATPVPYRSSEVRSIHDHFMVSLELPGPPSGI
jgi:uncharacterized protein (TIGR00290 family)